MKNRRMRTLGVFRAYIDDLGRVAIECFVCDELCVNMEEHLKETHSENPVAQRILSLLKEAREA